MKKVAAKKLDISAGISNLAVLSAVVVVSLPLLLGDQLTEVLSNLARQGAILIEGFANSVLMFLGLG
jgi:hypothetical protein